MKTSSVKVHDDIIDKELQTDVYNWVQEMSVYCSPLGKQPTDEEIQERIEQRKRDLAQLDQTGSIPLEFPIQEYNPTTMGKSVQRPVSTDEKENAKWENTQFTMYRHPIGWDDESLKSRSPIVWKLWKQINNKIFDNKATLDGMKEGHRGIYGPLKYFVDGIDFHQKYKCPRKIKAFTSMVNTRSALSPTISRRFRNWGGRMGQAHKDSDNSISDKHFSVFYTVNLKWMPHFGGNIQFYSNEYTGSKHWRHGYDIGWPTDIVGHRPNRIIVISHDQIHDTASPRDIAPEMLQKIAFRVKVN